MHCLHDTARDHVMVALSKTWNVLSFVEITNTDRNTPELTESKYSERGHPHPNGPS